MANNDVTSEIITRASDDVIVELIVKYSGDIQRVANSINNASVEILNSNYAILTLPFQYIPDLYNYREIEYFETPRSLSYNLRNALISSCITPVQNPNTFGLTGEGVLVAVIDSGIDITHPDFQNEDGTSRVLYLWDQTIEGNPPNGFLYGTEFNNAQLNEAIANPNEFNPFPGQDIAGHGTPIAGIMAGNGAASGGIEKGVAPQASIIAVKLDTSSPNYTTTTSQIMRGIKYAVDKSYELNMPLVINLSYGTNNGSHDGNSLFERYIDDMSFSGKTSIVVATGNEGSSGHHFSSTISQNQILNVAFSVADVYSSLFIDVWKDFVDVMTFELISPSGRSTGPITPLESYSRYYLDGTDVNIFYSQPNQYNSEQELFIQFNFDNPEEAIGLWHIRIRGADIVNGRIDMWLPANESISNNTFFLIPDVNNTLTIPSTAKNVISVAGYNSIINSIADFSGRGPLPFTGKPDIAAPAINIVTTRPNGGYGVYTGTSFASPFVAGSAALMMQWGIIEGNDPFLYGQRIKAFLKQGARRNLNIHYPNNQWGYGSLFLCETLDKLIQYTRNGGAFQ